MCFNAGASGLLLLPGAMDPARLLPPCTLRRDFGNVAEIICFTTAANITRLRSQPSHPASAGWVAVLLNVVPGLGAGYLYQRRWRAYWITSALATAWFVAGAVLAQNADAAAEAQNQLVGLIGLLVLAGVTATEAGLAVKRVRQNG